MNPGLIIAGIVGIAAWFAYAKKESAAILNYYLKGLSIDFDGITPILNINVVVQNPSNEFYQVNSIVADVFADDELIGNLSTFTTVKIPPTSEVTIPVKVRLKLLGIVTDIIDLIKNKSGIPKTLIFEGIINASGFVLPFNYAYNIDF